MTTIIETSPVYLHERVILKPKFYANTYWGGFRAGSSCDTEDVIFARTAFMLDSKSSREPTKAEYQFIRSYYQEFGLDHLEYYLGKDGNKYQVCSQHPGSLELTSQQMEDEGWRKIASMYQSSQDTYVRIYDKEREKIRQNIRNLLPEIHHYRSMLHAATKSLPEDQWYPGYWGLDMKSKLTRRELKLKEFEGELGYTYSEIVRAYP
jgi:hypothetical protein|tara:strand:- start:90 stop:710 length:621 start_codon:yes stop_codon:yes gene_type:complete